MERMKEIERSIIKTYRKELWAPFCRALDDFKLLKENDKVGVCISGGKDSMLMAKLFQELQRHSDFPFELEFIVMNPGYNEKNLNLIKENLATLGIPAKIYNSDIFEIANNQDKNPCYLCARMRRGCLYQYAKDLGCNKIAVGHHFDDVIETTLMNMLNSGSFQTMVPKLHSTNFTDMELIRPMYYIREKDIIRWSNYNDLHFIRCACKFTEGAANDEVSSKRKETKELIQSLKAMNPLVEYCIFKSTFNVNLNMLLGYKKDGVEHTFLERYEEEEQNRSENNDEDRQKN